MSPNAPVNEPSASDRDPDVKHGERDLRVLSSFVDADVPARRLLAHDLPHLVWDQDGDGPVPPPD